MASSEEAGDQNGGRSTVAYCVTGGTGFLGSWLVKSLLHHGYSVHTTVRPHNDGIRFLTELPGANHRLKIFEADLNDPDSFSAAIRSCLGVFHVATPMDFDRKETVEEIVRRSVEGALGIVKACMQERVKRVVYTSSASTVVMWRRWTRVTGPMDVNSA